MITDSKRKLPPEREICDNCQRCRKHCFDEPECRYHKVRFYECLTCSHGVAYWKGADPSVEKAYALKVASAASKTLKNFDSH